MRKVILSQLRGFPYSPGERFKRSDLHKTFGGSFRHGMTSANSKSDFLLFHDEESNHQFGYDIWQGFQADGSFHYTGQGIKGDQKMTRANLALIKADEMRHPIHLIESKGGHCTYIGRVVLGNPPFFEKQAPDIEKKGTRNVFVFNLLPLSRTIRGKDEIPVSVSVVGHDLPWYPPDFTPLIKRQEKVEESVVNLIENQLQAEFGNYLIRQGHNPINHLFTLPGSKGVLRPDFWIPSLKLVVEAKPSSAREFVRLAIGQALDYVNLAKLEGVPMSPAILLPQSPTKDLVQLINSLGITLILKGSDGFTFHRSN